MPAVQLERRARDAQPIAFRQSDDEALPRLAVVARRRHAQVVRIETGEVRPCAPAEVPWSFAQRLEQAACAALAQKLKRIAAADHHEVAIGEVVTVFDDVELEPDRFAHTPRVFLPWQSDRGEGHECGAADTRSKAPDLRQMLSSKSSIAGA